MDIKGFKSKDGTVHEYDYNSLANKPENDTATDERIAAAVEKYLTENPVDGVTDQQVYDAVVAYLTENPIEGVSDEQIAQAVADYMVKNPVDVTGVVKSVNGVEPDETGNVEITIPDSGANVDGLTATEKSLMLTLFKNIPYTGDVSAAYKSLETLWSSSSGGDSGGEDGGDSVVTYYTVTQNLTKVTSNYSGTQLVAGASLTVVLTADTNATLDTVTVTMGGEDITESVYSGNQIAIPSVTGDVVITAVAVEASYTQVDYLQAPMDSGNGYGILTNYTPSATDVIDIEFTPMVASAWLFPFSWCTTNATCAFHSRLDDVAGRTSFTHRYGASYSSQNDPDPDFAMPSTTGIRYRLSESPLGTATLYDADGNALVTLTDANANTCVDPASPVGLFAWFDSSTIRGNNSAKGLRIHSFKITDTYGTVKLDVIPVLDADGIACMYDKISGEYFYDISGNNLFTAGEAV